RLDRGRADGPQGNLEDDRPLRRAGAEAHRRGQLRQLTQGERKPPGFEALAPATTTPVVHEEERTMKKTITRFAAVAALTSLALAGCGLADEEPTVAAPTIEEEAPAEQAAAEAPEIEAEEPVEEEPAIEQGGPGVYQAELMSGGTATVAVPGTGPEELEQLRKDAGVDPVGYLVIEVDNTDGTDEAMVFEAEVVDSEGKTYTYEEVTTSTYDWTDDDFDLIDRQLELWDKYPYSTRPSAKNTVPLIGPEVPEDIVAVFIDYDQAERVGDL